MNSSPAPQAVTLTTSQQPARKIERRKYKRTLYWFGFIEMILGIASCGICIVGVIIASGQYKNNLASASSGIWCGLIQMLAGFVGLRTSRNSVLYLVKISMALSILAAICMAIMFSMSLYAAFLDDFALLSIFVFLSIIASAGFVLNIVHCAFCCATICCVNSESNTTRVYYHPGQPGVLRLANDQYLLVQGQSLIVPGYPGPPMLSHDSFVPSHVLPQHDHNKDLMQPPPYTSTENLNSYEECTTSAQSNNQD